MQRKVMGYGCSWSFNVIKIGTIRKPVCDFLLVFHYKYIPIFYRLRNITFFVENLRFCRFYSLRSRLKLFLSECSLKLRYEVGLEKLEFLGYLMMKTT